MIFKVIDIKTGKPVSGAIINTVDIANNLFLYEPVLLDATATFEIDTYNSSEFGLEFKAPGYKTILLTFAELMQSPDGFIYMEKSFPIALVVVALAAIFAYRNRTRKIGKLDKQDIQNIMLATGGLIGFALLKQLLESLGIWQDREGKELDNAATDPNSFWNPNFWRTKPDYINYSIVLTDTVAKQFAESIYNSISRFGDDEDRIKGIFRQMRTQSNVSYLAFWFLQLYNIDLLNFLRTGYFPTNGLSDADLYEISTFISKLPKY